MTWFCKVLGGYTDNMPNNLIGKACLGSTNSSHFETSSLKQLVVVL